MSLPVLTSGGVLTRASGYAIPNPAVAPIGTGFGGLWVPTLTGGNREVVDGHVATPRRIKQQLVDVPLVVVGDVSSDGTPQTPGPVGLWANMQELVAEFLDVTLTGDGSTVDTFVPFAGGPTLTGKVQGADLTVTEQHPTWWGLLLHLVLPDGPLS